MRADGAVYRAIQVDLDDLQATGLPYSKINAAELLGVSLSSVVKVSKARLLFFIGSSVQKGLEV